MKMPSLQPLKNKKKPTVRLGILMSLLFVVALLGVLFMTKFPEGQLAAVIEKTWKARNNFLSASGISLTSVFSDKEKLILENRKLESEIENLRIDNMRVKFLESEVESLRSFLEIEVVAEERIIADILSKPPFSESDVILVDANSRQGVSVGDLVLSGSGLSLGEIVRVNEHYSKAILFSIQGKKTQAKLDFGEQILLNGRGGGNFFLELPQGFEISEGDLVYLHERPLAEVVEILDSKNDPFIEVYLRQLSNIHSLTRVAIIHENP